MCMAPNLELVLCQVEVLFKFTCTIQIVEKRKNMEINEWLKFFYGYSIWRKNCMSVKNYFCLFELWIHVLVLIRLGTPSTIWGLIWPSQVKPFRRYTLCFQILFLLGYYILGAIFVICLGNEGRAEKIHLWQMTPVRGQVRVLTSSCVNYWNYLLFTRVGWVKISRILWLWKVEFNEENTCS